MASLVASVEAAPGMNGGASGAIDTTGADLLVMEVATYFGSELSGAATVSDSKGNTWTPLTHRGTGLSRVQLFYATNPTVGSGHTFTASSAGGFPAFTAMAFAGADITTPFDAENGATGGGVSALSTGSVTPAADGAILVAGLCLGGAVSGLSIGSGFTLEQEQPFGSGNNMGGAAAYLIQGAAAAVNPQWSWTGGTDAAAAIAAFKAAGGGGGGGNRRRRVIMCGSR